MKEICTLILIMLGFTAFSQQNVSNSQAQSTSSDQKNTENVANNVRSSAVSSQVRTSEPVPLPYDVNDKYMGRAKEFIGNLTVSELPSDFPLYDKNWSLKEYNQVVLAFYYNHLNIVKENVRKKLELLEH